MTDITEREYLSVVLTCYEYEGSLVLVDNQGTRFARIKRSRASALPAQHVKELERKRRWSIAANGWMGSMNTARRSRSRTAWDKKASVWLVSLRHRRNRTRPLRARTTERECTRWRRANWDIAISRMKVRHWSAVRKQGLRESHHWVLWAETVSGNLKKRTFVHGCEKQSRMRLISDQVGSFAEA